MSGADAALCQAKSYMRPERDANATAIQNQDAPPMAAMARHLLQQSGMQIDLGHASRKSACLQLLLELLQSQPIGRFPVIEAVFHSLLIIRIGKMTHMKQIGGDFIQFRA